MRAAIYLRPLPEDRRRRDSSLESLRETCAARAYQLGAAEVLEFSDRNSDETLQRPGISLLREAVARRLIGLLVCESPERLSRKRTHQLLLTVELEQAGVKLEFIRPDWLQSAPAKQLYAMQRQVIDSGLEPVRYFSLLDARGSGEADCEHCRGEKNWR